MYSFWAPRQSVKQCKISVNCFVSHFTTLICEVEAYCLFKQLRLTFALFHCIFSFVSFEVSLGIFQSRHELSIVFTCFIVLIAQREAPLAYFPFPVCNRNELLTICQSSATSIWIASCPVSHLGFAKWMCYVYSYITNDNEIPHVVCLFRSHHITGWIKS